MLSGHHRGISEVPTPWPGKERRKTTSADRALAVRPGATATTGRRSPTSGWRSSRLGLIDSKAAGGTLAYQPPQLLSGAEPTPASDVYALSLILYEMLAGENPFDPVQLQAVAEGGRSQEFSRHLRARQDRVPPPLGVEDPELTEHRALVDIVHRCLRHQGSDRYEAPGALPLDYQANPGGRAGTQRPRPRPDPPGSPSAHRRRGGRPRTRMITSAKLAELKAAVEFFPGALTQGANVWSSEQAVARQLVPTG